MKQKLSSSIILVFLLVCQSQLFSQHQFERFTTEDGLSNNSIRRIIQDKKGFIWFGTLNGLNRFDGKNIKTYTFEPGNLKSFSSNRVFSMFEDSFNYLWVISFENQILRYNPKTEQFENINILLKDELKKHYGQIALYESSPGIIWVITRNEFIIKIIEDEGSDKIKTEIYNLNNLIPSAFSTNIFKDSKGNLWLGTSNALLKMNSDTLPLCSENIHFISAQNQPIQINYIQEIENTVLFGTQMNGIFTFSDNAFQQWRSDLKITSSVNQIYKGKKNNLLITTANDGFFYFPAFNAPYIQFSKKTTNQSDVYNSYFEVFEDKEGLFWIIGPNRGVHMFNPQKNSVKLFGLNADFRESPGDLDKQSILEDSNGDLWIGLYGGGLCKFNRTTETFIHYYYSRENTSSLSSNFILSLFEDASKNLWIGTFQGGLNKIDLKHHNFNFTEPVANARFKSENETRSLFEDKYNRLWAGTKEGHIYCYNNNQKLIFKIPENLSGSINYQKSNVYAIEGDKYGNLWIGTKGEGLLCIRKILNDEKLIPGKYSAEKYINDPSDSLSLPYNDIFALHVDIAGQLWVGTYNSGIALVENPQEKFAFKQFTHVLSDSNSISDGRIRCFYEDSQHNMWIGTSYGLNLMESKYLTSHTKKFSRYTNNPTEKSTLSNNDILYIHEDQEKNIWAATYGGGLNLLKHENIHHGIFHHFLRKDGLPSDVIFSILEDNQGNLWLGTDNGLCKFHKNGYQFERFIASNGTGDNFFSEGTCEMNEDGEFIFGLKSGFLRFHPDSIKKDSTKYPLVFTGLKIFDQPITPGTKNSPLTSSIEFTHDIQLKHNQNFISIEFALLDYKSPNKIQYAFKLENFEDNWNYVINQNSATYRGLSPGNYVFKVKSNSNNSVAHKPIELRIHIKPPYWKTTVAYILYIILIIFIITGIYYLLGKEIKIKNEINFEKRLTEDKLMFYTNISHEFKTPLTLINNSTDDLLESNSLTDEFRKKITLIKRNSTRLHQLIEQLLDFRRIQKGKMELKVRNVEIISFLNDLYQTFIPLAEKKNITFLFNSNYNEYHGWMDPKHIEKIVINLLSNAFKHSPENKFIHFTITIITNNLNIQIIDQGDGIKKENLNKIFDRFAFIDKDIYNQFKGSGIGLSLSRDLVQLHKGLINVTSELGLGSTFEIQIPVNKSAYSELECDENANELDYHILPLSLDIDEDHFIESTDTPAIKTSSAIKSQVLIIEDNEELRNFLLEKLKKSFTVFTAIDGIEGLKLADEIIPDLILSDVKMPNMDGLELTKSIRNNINTSHIPVILLTAKSALEHKIEGLEYGADDYITKPFSVHYLQKRIINIINQRKMLKEKFSNDPGNNPDKLGISEKDQKFLTEVINQVEANLKTPNYSIENIIEEMGFSRTVFYKKMKNISGYAPKEFIRIVKMKRAATLLREPDSTITQVSYDIGYNDPDYFSKSFKNYFGEPPSEYRKRYR